MTDPNLADLQEFNRSMEINRLKAEKKDLKEALQSLVNNYRGLLSVFGYDIRHIAGHTNYEVAEHWLKNAEQALSKYKGE